MKEGIQQFLKTLPEEEAQIPAMVSRKSERWIEGGVQFDSSSELGGAFLVTLPKGANIFSLSTSGVEALRDFCNRHLKRIEE